MHRIALVLALAPLLCACGSQQNGPLRYEWGELRDKSQQGHPPSAAAPVKCLTRKFGEVVETPCL